MKRIISISLAIMLIFSCMFLLTGCIPEDGPGVNEGYKSFNNGALSFDYPEGWLNLPFVNEISGTNMIMDLEGSGNNININSLPKTDVYDQIPDADTFIDKMSPELEAQGLIIKNGEMEKGNTNGLDYILFAFDSEQSGLQMHQTMIFTNISDFTYMIVLTEVESNPEHLDALLSTLAPVK